MNRICTVFPNCLKLTSQLNMDAKTLYAHIRTYNEYVARYNKRNKNNPIEGFVANKQYTDDELNKLGSEMKNYFIRLYSDADFARSEIKSAAKNQHITSESYALDKVQSSSLNSAELSDILTDIVRTFIANATKWSVAHNQTVDDTIKDGHTSYLFEVTRRQFNKIHDAQLRILDEEKLNHGSHSKEEIDKATKIDNLFYKCMSMDNYLFNELSILSLKMINDMLSVKINSDMLLNKVNYTEEVANVEDMEEPTIEHWSDALEHKTPESSISKIIRRVVMSVPQISLVETTKWFIKDKDRLGRETFTEVSEGQISSLSEEQKRKLVPKNDYKRVTKTTTITGSPYPSNPDAEARRLLDLLEFATDEDDMMALLRTNEYYKDSELYTILENNSTLRTTFFNDFYKYFLEMSSVEYSMNEDGTINVKVPPLNKSEKEGLLQKYNSDLSMGNLRPGTFFVGNLEFRNGKATNKNRISVNYAKFLAAYNFFKDNFIRQDKNTPSPFENNVGTDQHANMLHYILLTLNIDVPADVLSEVVSSKYKTTSVVNALEKFFNEAEDKGLFNNSRMPKEANNIVNTIKRYNKLKSSLNTILSIVTPRRGSVVNQNNMVHYLGSSLTSRILPSAWTIFIKNINSYKESALKDYIDSRFMISSNFSDKTGLPLNRWLRDIRNSAGSEVGGNAFRNSFGIMRCLGIDDIDFEHISSREHMLSILYSYLQNRNWQLSRDAIDAEFKNGELYTKDNNGNYTVLQQLEDRQGKVYRIKDSNEFVRYLDKKGGNESFTASEMNDLAVIPMFITGDTNQLRLFKTPHYSREEILDSMYGLYLSDIATMNFIRALDKAGISVTANGKESMTRYGNGNKFGILTFLNDFDFMNTKEVIKIVGKSDIKSLTQDQIYDISKIFFEQEANKFYTQNLDSLGIFEKVDGKYKYFDYLLSDIGQGKENLTDDDKREIDRLKEERLKSYFKDFIYDYIFGMYNQTHISHITSLSFNGTEEHQKRNKVHGTTGTALSALATINGERLFEDNKFEQTAIYFKDVSGAIDEKSNAALLKFIRTEYAKNHTKEEVQQKVDFFVDTFKKNSLTDGQGYRLFDSYRKILGAAGENYWTAEQEDAYNKIDSIIARVRGTNENLTVDEIQEIENLMVVMQPIKPVNDGIEIISYNNNDNETKVSISFQFKYAEVPLIPELYPANSKLRQIGTWMYNNHIDLLCSDKCLKKGSFGEIDIQYVAQNGQYVNGDEVLPGYDQNYEEVAEPTMAEQRRYIDVTGDDRRVEYGDNVDFNTIINNQTVKNGRGQEYRLHTIPLDNYLIQNNIPNHSIGNVIFGTQPRKIIGSLIDNNETYNFNIGGKEITVNGEKLFRVWNMLHTVKYIKSFEQFMSLVNNQDRLTRNLSYLISNNDRTNLATLLKISIGPDGKPQIPYSESSNQHDIINNIVSIFKKIVVRKQIHGGNIVQASALGCGSTALQDPDLKPLFDEDNNLYGVEVEMPFIFEAQDEDGNIIRLKYKDYCYDNGEFKLDDDGTPLIEKEYPGILDFTMNRIPTEGGYSMYHARIKRCNPITGANVIKMPKITTKISDFDFDIDKMFFQFRTFTKKFKEIKFRDDNGNVIGTDNKVWKTIYDDNPTEIYLKLLQAKENATKEELVQLAEDKHTTIDKLHINHFWELAKINKDKQEVFDEYYQKLIDDNSIVEGSTYDFQDEGSSIMELSNEVIDNAIIDIEQAVLSHKSTMLDRITPGGFDVMKEDGRRIRLLLHPEIVPGFENGINSEKEYNEFLKVITSNNKLDYDENLDFYDPLTEVIYKQRNQIAGQEIGIFANDNVNDAISSRMLKLEIREAKNAILFGSLVNQKAEVIDKNGNKTTGYNSGLGMNFLFDYVNGRKLSKTLHELLGSSVDAVKDNALIAINLNGITGDMGAMLVRLGYSTYDVGLLFNQPIVKEVCEYMSRNNEKNFSTALKMCVKKYVSKNISINSIFKKDIELSKLTSSQLGLSLTKTDYDVQVEVAKLMNRIANVKQELSNYVQNTRNTSANTVKTDFGDFLTKQEKHGKYIAKPDGDKLLTIKSSQDLGYPITEDWTKWNPNNLSELHKQMISFMDEYNNHPFTYENALYNIIQFSMTVMMNRFTPFGSDIYTAHRNELNNYVAPWGIDGNHINELHLFLPGLILSELDGDFNPDASNNPIGVTNKEYYLKRIDELMGDEDISSDEATLSFILDNFSEGFCRSGKEGRENSEVFFKLNDISGKNSVEKFGLTIQYEDLMRKGGKFAQLGKALFLHNYYVRGLNPSGNQIMEIAPISVLKSLVASESYTLSYLDTFTEEGMNSLLNDALRFSPSKIRANVLKYIIYHNNDETLCRNLNIKPKKIDDKGSIIEITGDDIKKCYLASSGLKGSGLALYRPIIKIQGKLYALVPDAFTEFHIGDDINNELNSNDVRTLIYTEVQGNKDLNDSEYNGFFNPYNNFIFEDFMTPSVKEFDDSNNDDIISDNSEENNKQPGEDAANRVDTTQKLKDADGIEEC